VSRGHTLLELLVVVAVAGTLAAVSVPGVAWVTGRSATGADALCFALVLRRAQAPAASSGRTVSVRLVDDGLGYECVQTLAGAETVLDRGGFHVPCSTNYPGGVVEFGVRGWPCGTGGQPRAGTFSFAAAGASAQVVVQLGGRVRWQ
jgi:prepilin-type N-terminal cleavage/methylation domain-containing protein